MSESEITTILGRGASFDGKLTFDGSVRIDGNFSGEIETSGSLLIGEHARVEAKIQAGEVSVEGQFRGELFVDGLVDICASGRVYGQLCVGQLAVERGSIFEGSCKMGHESAGEETPSEAAAAE